MRSLSLFLCIIFSFVSYASVSPGPVANQSFDLRKIKIKELEKLKGKKLALLQKIKLKVILKGLGKLDEGTITEKQKKQADAAMILGIGSLILLALIFSSIGIIALLSIPAGLLAVILGSNSRKGNNNTKGLIGEVAGAITLGFVLAYTILILIAFGGGIK